MELTKGFVQHCNKPSVLREFLLQAMEQIGKLEAELAASKESQRWRKYPEEKPEEKCHFVFCCTKSGTRDTNFWHERAGKWEFKFYDKDVVAWMPLPK